MRSRTRRLLWAGASVAVAGAALAGLYWRYRPAGIVAQGPDQREGLAQMESRFGSNARTAFRDVWFVRQYPSANGPVEYLRFTFRERAELIRLMSMWEAPKYPEDLTMSCSGDEVPEWWDAPARVEVFKWGIYRVCVDETKRRAYLFGAGR